MLFATAHSCSPDANSCFPSDRPVRRLLSLDCRPAWYTCDATCRAFSQLHCPKFVPLLPSASSTLASPKSPLVATLRRVVVRHEERVSTRSRFSLGASRAWQYRINDNMATVPGDKKTERSTWASAVDSINPWSVSRSSTPVPKEPMPSPTPKPANSGGDHSINPIYGLSVRRYPPDCPPLKVQWFHAVDVGFPGCTRTHVLTLADHMKSLQVPKRKPELIRGRKKPAEVKPPIAPKKWVPFSPHDSRSIESAYQNVLEAKENDQEQGRGSSARITSASRRGLSSEVEASDDEAGTQIPVNEDYLFE